MSMLRFILVFGLIVGLLTSGSADQFEHLFNNAKSTLLRDGLGIDINKFLDDNIENVQHIAKQFDPTKLPDVPLWNKGQLTEGWLSVLSSVQRTGDCFLDYADKILHLDLKLGWDILKYDFNYAFKLWFIQRYGQVHGSVEDINIHLKIYVDFRNYNVVLEQFKFGNVGKLSLKLEGTFGDKIRSFFATLIMNLAKTPIMYSVEKVATNVLKEQINEINKQLTNQKHTFKFINLEELNRNKYVIEEYNEEYV